MRETINLNENQEINQAEKREASFDERLTDLVGQVYQERSAGADPAKTELLLKDNLDHISQVKDNTEEIINKLKSGEGKESFIPRDEKGQVVFDEKLLKAMAILHDVAKIDEAGKLDTFYHHEREKVAKILSNESSPIQQFLVKNNFSQEEIDLIIDGIEKHSRRTDFIYRKFYNKNKDEARFLPAPEGVLEYVVLSDADILTQSKLEQGVKKIICSRLFSETFRRQDSEGGRHSFIKTLDSVMESAQRVNEAMHFEITKQKAAKQLEEVKAFEAWLKENNKIKEIDDAEDFSVKKKIFDELIREFLVKKRN